MSVRWNELLGRIGPSRNCVAYELTSTAKQKHQCKNQQRGKKPTEKEMLRVNHCSYCNNTIADEDGGQNDRNSGSLFRT